jgi:hypothetical protein
LTDSVERGAVAQTETLECYLAGPLVLHRSLWGDATPSWLKVACVQDRFELILSEYEQEQVGDYCCISTTSAPNFY